MSAAVEEKRLVPTGVQLLDTALGGGVAPGSFVLALGEPTSGMELLAKQFAASAPDGGDVLVWSPDESETEWREVMQRFGDPANVRVVDIASEYFDRVYGARHVTAAEGIHVRGILPAAKAGRPRIEEPAIPDFLDEVVHRSMAARPHRIVIDTLDFFTELYSSNDIVRALRALRIVNREGGGLLLATKIKGTSDASLERMLQHVADVVLDFSVEPTAQEFSWRLAIKKVRNEPQKAASFAYNPTPNGLARDTRRRV